MLLVGNLVDRLFKSTGQSSCIIAAVILAATAAAPMLALTTHFHDDWAFIWVHHYRGAGELQNILWQYAHPGAGLYYNLLFWLDSENPARPARLIGLSCHLLNGWLLWLIFLRA